MVDIARSHSEKKILESLIKLHPTINVGPGKVDGVLVNQASGGRPRIISLTLDYVLSPEEFAQVLEDSLEDPRAGRTMTVLQ